MTPNVPLDSPAAPEVAGHQRSAAERDIEAWLEELDACTRAGTCVDLGSAPLQDAPHSAEVVFPAVWRFLEDRRHEREVLALTRAYCVAGLLAPTGLTAILTRLLAAHRGFGAACLASHATGDPGFRHRSGYARQRELAACRIDVLGFAPIAETEAVLRETADWPDPLLALHAVVALWRQGADVSPRVVHRLQVDLETRAWIWECCAAAGRSHLLMPGLTTPVALAASAVAVACAEARQDGQLPLQVELASADRAGGDEHGWWYLFHAHLQTPTPRDVAPEMVALAGPLPEPDSREPAAPALVACDAGPPGVFNVTEQIESLLGSLEQFPIAPPCR